MEVERVRFIDHKGKPVLLLDFSNCRAEDVSKVIVQAGPLVPKATPHSLLTLSDMTNITIKDFSTRQLVTFAKGNGSYVKAAAVIGVSGLAKSIMATTVLLTKRKILAFGTRQEALDWLVST
jgi:hypothetical protein